jgi:hypothetical protein
MRRESSGETRTFASEDRIDPIALILWIRASEINLDRESVSVSGA